MGNKKRKQCRFQNTCLRVETNYRTVTGDQKAFGWTEVIFIDHEIFFYREIFGLLELLGMQPRNNKKISVWCTCLSLCFGKGSFLSQDLVWRYTVYHCITGEQICQWPFKLQYDHLDCLSSSLEKEIEIVNSCKIYYSHGTFFQPIKIKYALVICVFIS